MFSSSPIKCSNMMIKSFPNACFHAIAEAKFFKQYAIVERGKIFDAS